MHCLGFQPEQFHSTKSLAITSDSVGNIGRQKKHSGTALAARFNEFAQLAIIINTLQILFSYRHIALLY